MDTNTVLLFNVYLNQSLNEVEKVEGRLKQEIEHLKEQLATKDNQIEKLHQLLDQQQQQLQLNTQKKN